MTSRCIINIVKKYDEAYNNKVDSGGKAISDNTKESCKRVGITINKNSINFYSFKV